MTPTKFDRKSIEEAVRMYATHNKYYDADCKKNMETLLALAFAYLDNSLSERPMMTEEEIIVEIACVVKSQEVLSFEWTKKIAHALSNKIPAPEKVSPKNKSCCTATGEHWWLKKEPNVCSICGFNKKDKVITYEDWKGVIRDTPLTIKGLKQVGRTLFFVDLDDESIGVLATSIIDYLNKRERSDE